MSSAEGILLVDKPAGKTSFSVIAALRRLLGVAKIGHCGTLDPFATGLLIILVGRSYTRLSDQLMGHDKMYTAELLLGVETDSYDCDGQIVAQNDHIPSLQAIEEAIALFQGEVEQIPPMFSAKKVQGRKLYELARKGIEIERKAATVTMKCHLISYNYPKIIFDVECSKGTYIRSIAHDLGRHLQCGAHLTALRRVSSGTFSLDHAIDGVQLFAPLSETALLLNKALITAL